jgi:predicted enzyme related to lactoylglutathione lyase
MRLAILAVLSLSAVAPLPAQQSDDQKAVIGAIEKLFNALKADDTAGMRAVMHPQGRIIQTGTRDGAPFARVNALNDFLTSIGNAKGRGLEERVYSPEVRIDDNLAVAWVYYDFRVGGQVSHCGVDAYHLVRTADGWRILEIVDTQRREACDQISKASQATRDRQIDYIEIPVTDVAKAKAFYSSVFGWTFTDYGPDYTSFMDGRLGGGLRKETTKAGKGALVVVYARNLEEMKGKVAAAGAKISQDIQEFPGGRRFHFIDPSGNELAVWSDR